MAKDQETGAASAPTRHSGTVTVACKLPNGLILKNYRMVDTDEPVMGGGTKTVQVAEQDGGEVRIFGNAVPFGQTAEHRIVSGYALTRGVSAEFFERWLKANAHSDIVKNRLVFAHQDGSQVADQAKEHKSVKSGLEPLAIDRAGKLKDARAPSGIKVADEQKAKPVEMAEA